MRTKVVLVTGALGYIGSVLTSYLQARGVSCVGYDTGFFRDCTLYPPTDPPTRLRNARDFREEDLDGVDAVVHLAGISNDPMGDLSPHRVYNPTWRHAVRIATFCKARRVKFIFASSCSIYGIGGADFVTEDSEPHPQTPYSLNKLQVEQDLTAMSDVTFRPVILRFATVYGVSPRMRFDLFLNMFVGMALTSRTILLNSDGRAWRPSVHVRDVCKAIAYSLEYEPAGGSSLILNVGSTNENHTVLEIARLVQAQVPGCELVFLQDMDQRWRRQDLELVRDRKVRSNVDTRTYRVSFERITSVFKDFRCEWDVCRGVGAMVGELSALPLTAVQFQDRAYYRLQKLESLLADGHLTHNLTWRLKETVVS